MSRSPSGRPLVGMNEYGPLRGRTEMMDKIEDTFGWLFENRTVKLPLALWMLIALVGLLGWVL